MIQNGRQLNEKSGIDLLTERLASRLAEDLTVNNFYSKSTKNINPRLDNLSKYLNYYAMNSPKIILIGEAPGYKGCALSGIPFTSQSVISASKFFTSKDINYIGSSQKENTATIMWRLFDEIERYPLLWNAFPFHPHHLNSKKTNRKPNKQELQEGLEYINILKDIFPKAKLIAVGNVAFQSLDSLGLNIQKVRHPSYGGKNEFDHSMRKILNT